MMGAFTTFGILNYDYVNHAKMASHSSPICFDIEMLGFSGVWARDVLLEPYLRMSPHDFWFSLDRSVHAYGVNINRSVHAYGVNLNSSYS